MKAPQVIGVKVDGLKELQENLRFYERKIETAIVKTALRRAVAPATTNVRRATYTTVTRRTGLLKAGLGVRSIRASQGPNRTAAGLFAKKASQGFVSKARAGKTLRSRKRKGGSYREVTEPFYWKFIEFGTARMRARPYVAAAFESAIPAMLDAYKASVARGLEKVAPQRPHR
jgi:HK97 gp10 family phage protein